MMDALSILMRRKKLLSNYKLEISYHRYSRVLYILHCVLYYVMNTSDLSFPFLLPSLVLSSEKIS